jgi:hypothetical protein
MVTPEASFAVPLAASIRAHLEEARQQVVDMPRAGPAVNSEDARQMIRAIYVALLEHLDGTGTTSRDAFIEDVARASSAAGVPAQTLIVGVIRAYMVLVAHVSHELAPEVREAAGRHVGEFAGRLVSDLVRVYGEPRGG